MERQYQCLRCGHDSRTHECEQIAHAKMVDLQRALDAERRERRAVEQIAGQALGYPWFKDDQKNFPGATEADGVCIGEHVAGTIVQELASKLATLQAQADHTRIERNRLWGELADLQAQLADRDAVILQMGEQAAVLAKENMAVKAQLRQVEGERDHAKKMEAVQKEVADNQTWHVQKLKGWRDTVTLALQRPGGARFEDVPGHIKALVKEHDTLRQLVEVHTKQLTELTIIPIGCSREQELRWTQSIKDLRAALADVDAALQPERGEP